MRQQVNLHHAFVKPPVRLPARILGPVVLVFAIVLLALGAHTRWQASKIDTELQQRQQALAAMNNEMTELGQQIDQLQPSAALQQRIERTQRQVQYRDRQLRALQGGEHGQRHGYSAALAALARQHQEGLWLTAIEMRAGSRELQISGRSLSANLLPAWLSNLENETVFAGRQFRHFELQRDDELDQLYFHIRSACIGEDCPAASDQPRGAR